MPIKLSVIFKDEEPKKPKIEQTSEDFNQCYKNIVFESKAKYLYKNPNEKKLFTYDKSLERIKSINPNSRHPRPQEVFSLLIDNLEGKLYQIEEDMFNSYGEWLSLAVERKDNILITHLDPEGLLYNRNKYVKQDFKSTETKEFNIEGIQSQTWIKIEHLPKELTKYLFTKTYEELPETIQKQSHICLPPNNTLWPVVHGNYDYNLVIYFYRAASRRVTFIERKK